MYKKIIINYNFFQLKKNKMNKNNNLLLQLKNNKKNKNNNL